MTEMTSWINSGKIKPVEHVIEGLENAPNALRGIFDGENLGKSVVHISD